MGASAYGARRRRRAQMQSIYSYFPMTMVRSRRRKPRQLPQPNKIIGDVGSHEYGLHRVPASVQPIAATPQLRPFLNNIAPEDLWTSSSPTVLSLPVRQRLMPKILLNQFVLFITSSPTTDDGLQRVWKPVKCTSTLLYDSSK